MLQSRICRVCVHK